MMGRALATYIALPGTTAQAMEHWHDVFGGDLNIQRYKDVPSDRFPFKPDPEAVAHATLTLDSGDIAGGDTVASENDFQLRGTAYSLPYTSESPKEDAEYIHKLVSAGRPIGMPFKKA